MKNSNLNLMGVQELNTLEMQETDGGLVLIILVFCATFLALSSCRNGPLSVQIDTSNLNTKTGDSQMSANSSKLEIPIEVPIGY